MIGKVYLSYVDYYDSATKTTKKKARPVLIVGGPRNNDYTVLPVSTISRQQNRDATYDVLVDQRSRAVLSLDRECYVRTHKQIYMHQGQLLQELGDMKQELPDLYLEAVSKMEQFQKELVELAI